MTAKHDMKKLVEEIYAVRDRGDIEGTLALTGEDCTFRIVGNARLGPFSSEAAGPHAFRQAITQLITEWDLSAIRTVGIHVDEDDHVVFAHREGEVRYLYKKRSDRYFTAAARTLFYQNRRALPGKQARERPLRFCSSQPSE
jgi:ketosteroid isomerase-like protein